MDRRHEADEQWFMSPLLNLKDWMDQAYEREKQTYEALEKPHNKFVKEENAHLQQMEQDFAKLVSCSNNTARHLFEKDLKKVLERVADQDKPWKKNEFQRKCKYYRFGQYDYKLARTFPEWHDPCEKDIILMVDVAAPHNKMLSAEEMSNCRVCCVSDLVVELEEGKEYMPANVENSHALKFPSAFIFINDTFYIDLSRPRQTDISYTIREFMSRKAIFDPVKAVDIDGVKIRDLKLRLGQPYLYMHSGTCEHLLIFHNLSLLHRSDEQDISKYPMVAYEKFGDAKCAACKSDYATYQVNDCDRLPQPMLHDLEGSSNKEYVLIQYPGIINDVNKAVRTLGGLSTITQVTSGTVRLVLRIKRKKKDPNVVEATCLGLVNYVYTFESMCDFQYIPLKRKPDNTYTDLIPSLIPTGVESALQWWENEEDPNIQTPLFLPPFQFSRYTSPSTKLLCRETDYGSEKAKRKTGHGQNLRTERKALSLTVLADEQFPDLPSQEAIDDANFRCKNAEPHHMMAKLFEERPMWTRVAISYKTKLEEIVIKSLLQKYAFYVQSGPWGRLWCRFGYDPRLDPNAKQYQTLMVTFRQHTKIPERQRLKVSMDRLGNTKERGMQNINYVYEPGMLPKVRQMWYSICDIQLPLAYDILSREFAAPQNVAKEGFIPEEVLRELRNLVKEDVFNTTEEMDGNEEDFEIADDF